MSNGYPATATYITPDDTPIANSVNTTPEPAPQLDLELLAFLEATGLNHDHYLATAVTHLVTAARNPEHYTREVTQARNWAYAAITANERSGTRA